MVLEENRVEDHVKDCVKDLGSKVIQSLLAADVSALAALLDDGFVLRLPDGERVDKKQWLRQLAAGEIRYDRLTAELTAIHVYDGQVAFVSGHSQPDKTQHGKRIAGRFPYTALFVCRGGSWQLVAVHQIEDGSPARGGVRAGFMPRS